MADFTITIQGIDILQKKFEPSNLLGEATRQLLEDTALFLNERTRMYTPVDTGNLRSRWEVLAMDTAEIPAYFEFGNIVDYALPVEYGSNPHWMPFNALHDWAHRHGDDKSGHLEAGAWWAIGIRGTKPHYMLQKGFSDTVDEMPVIVSKAADKVEERFGL